MLMVVDADNISATNEVEVKETFMWQTLRKVYLSSRKPTDSVFNTWVARPLATPLVIFFEKVGVTPNQVSLMGLMSMISAALIWSSIAWLDQPMVSFNFHLWIGLALVELAYLFDCADGQLARRTNRSSKLGAEFDFLVDELKAYLLLLSLSLFWWASQDRIVDALLWAGVGLASLSIALSLTRFVRTEVVQADGMVGEQTHGDSAAQPTEKSLMWWVIRPARLVTQYPQSLPFFIIFEAVDLFVMLYASLHALYGIGRLIQVSFRMASR